MRPPVTRCFRQAFKIGGNPYAARYFKREAHRRHRAAVREYLARGDWDGGVIHLRPITGWDVI